MLVSYGRVLFQEDGRYIQNLDQQVVNVVLQVYHLLALGVHGVLEADHHLDEVLPGLAVVPGQHVVREAGPGDGGRGRLRPGRRHPRHQLSVVPETWRMSRHVIRRWLLGAIHIHKCLFMRS